MARTEKPVTRQQQQLEEEASWLFEWCAERDHKLFTSLRTLYKNHSLAFAARYESGPHVLRDLSSYLDGT